MIQIKNLNFGYAPDRTVLSVADLNIDLNSCGLYVIIGPNGAGKSTLCKLLSGVLTSGNGATITLPNPPPVLVWQEREVFPLSVSENVYLVCRDSAKTENYLSDLGLLPLKNEAAEKLSGGEKARLAISRALAAERGAIIFDEPTASVDPGFVDVVAKEILKIKAVRVVVTHDARLMTLLSAGNPETYILEPSDVRGDKVIAAQLRGPYQLGQLFTRPPTAFAAEFVGYENIYGLTRDAKPDSFGVRQLQTVAEGRRKKADLFVVLPFEALEVSNQHTTGSVVVQIVGEEFRSNGLVVTRIRWKPQGGNENLDFLLPRGRVSGLDPNHLNLSILHGEAGADDSPILISR